MSEAASLLTFSRSNDQGRATLNIDATKKSAHRVNPYLYGKFCEHLGWNIYNGMEAQILRNPTFARWPFATGENLVYGGAEADSNVEGIKRRAENFTKNQGLPAAARLFDSYQDSLAYFWSRLGTKEDVRYSNDVGPYGGRAQRVEVLKESSQECGLAQFTFLPLHRTRKYEYRIVARAMSPVDVSLTLGLPENDGASARALVSSKLSLKNEWQTLRGTLEFPAGEKLTNTTCLRLALTTSGTANIVVERVLLYPGDHVNYADPEVIQMLRDAKLPLLRWPGGNFVSGYRWRDGVGPVDQRPTRPNPAWEGLEFNFFGTDEFMAYCKVVGCEPLICVNGGDGTPEEAAAWIEYCNGSANTPMGKLRAQNGHPEPYNVKLWEIGNELSGPWQVSWTYSGGYADRYLRFRESMLKADASIRLIACGGIGECNGEWNTNVIAACAPKMQTITDHILNGVRVGSDTDPAELYHAFMGHSVQLGKSYAKLRDYMKSKGIAEPRIAVTECQLFPRWQGEVKPDGKLTPQTMIHPATIAEAIYFTTIVHECIRLGDFVEMFTHSATANHGGGLRKHKERSFGNPVHYAHVMGAPLMNGTPVAVELSSATYSTKTEFATIPPLENIPAVDAMAVLGTSGKELIVMLCHRSATAGSIQLALGVKGFSAAESADVLTLADEVPYGANTNEEPEKIVPRPSSVKVADGKVSLTLPAYSVARVTLKKA